VRRASETERARLNDTFAALCRIESPSGQERACADWVTAELETIGLDVQEDASGPAVGSEAGNLLARIPGRAQASILICAHLDTVPPVAPIEPVLVDGFWENANEGILGADNKSAVAVALELARRLKSAPEPPPVGVEFLFTVCEEVSLRGSREFDVSQLESSFGFVFDHATPIGQVVVASPSHYRIVAEFHGRAAHAGVRPEAGRSAIAAAAKAIAAMRLGRLDAETRASSVATELVDHLEDAANATECDLDLTVEQMFRGYRTKARAPQLAVAERALRACGYEPVPIDSGGASDANSFETAGFACTNLADGTERNHEPGERISAQDLEVLLDIAITIVEEAAAELVPSAGA
jgi:tripeptide aminopeptidase